MPEGHQLKINKFKNDLDPVIKTSPNLRGFLEYIWELNQPETVEYESNLPSWYFPRSFVEVSDYKDWQDVVNTVLPYFSVNEIPDDLLVIIEKIKSDHKEIPERIIACLNFVQKEIRYLSLGETHLTYRPSNLNFILKNGFGDCKDKTLLLIAMLRRLEIDAHPALVSSADPFSMQHTLPNLSNFDHIIVYMFFGSY